MPKTIYISNTDLTKDKRFTYLTEDVIAAGTTLRVQSILGFESLTTSSGQIVCIGDIGNEKTEILRTSQNTGPSSSYREITLRDSLAFDHPQDTKVYIIDYNRFEVQWASTVTGTKSTLQAYPQNILADLPENVYVDTTQTSGFYFVRFNDSINNRNTDFSDAIPFGGYADNTVYSIKKRALESVGEVIDTDLITHDFLNMALWEGRREFHQAPGKRPFRRKFNIDIGNVSTGMYRIVLPEDVEKPYTAENIYGVRIGAEANMEYYDKKEWDFDFRNKPHTTLTATYSVGARDLYVDSTRDFATTGVVSIAQTNVEYSAKSISGGTFRISLDGSYGVDNGADVWQNVTYGLPDKFTVFGEPGGSAFIYFNRPIETAQVDKNIFLDYYRKVVDFDSDADVLDEPNYDMFVPYLAFRIKQRKNKGLNPLTDSDYQQWQFRKSQSLGAEYGGVEIRIAPQIDHLPIP